MFDFLNKFLLSALIYLHHSNKCHHNPGWGFSLRHFLVFEFDHEMSFALPFYCCCHQYSVLTSTSSELELDKIPSDVTSLGDVTNGEVAWLAEIFVVEITEKDKGGWIETIVDINWCFLID